MKLDTEQRVATWLIITAAVAHAIWKHSTPILRIAGIQAALAGAMPELRLRPYTGDQTMSGPKTCRVTEWLKDQDLLTVRVADCAPVIGCQAENKAISTALRREATSWRKLKHAERERRLQLATNAGGGLSLKELAPVLGFKAKDQCSRFVRDVTGRAIAEFHE